MRTRSLPHRLLPVVLLGLGLSAVLSASPGADCAAAWGVVPSPNGGSGDQSVLSDLAVVSANDIWAVGNQGNGTSQIDTLIEHWNGSSWSVVPSPNGIYPINYLISVSAVSSTDVWAAGYTYNGIVSDAKSQNLTLHWNGSVWSVVPSPNRTVPENRLLGVVAISANDVWAVGDTYDYTRFKSLTMHWNGSAWSIVSSPNPGSSFTSLHGLAALASNDVWAVGTQQDFQEQTLAMHWDGTSWKVVSTPNVGPYGNNLLQVSAGSPTDIWAVGYHLTVVGFSEPYQTTALHYDGTSWTAVTTPDVNQNNNYLFDVVSLAPDDAWAVGFYDTLTALNTMIQHWDGSAWTIVESPSPEAVHQRAVRGRGGLADRHLGGRPHLGWDHHRGHPGRALHQRVRQRDARLQHPAAVPAAFRRRFPGERHDPDRGCGRRRGAERGRDGQGHLSGRPYGQPHGDDRRQRQGQGRGQQRSDGHVHLHRHERRSDGLDLRRDGQHGDERLDHRTLRHGSFGWATAPG